jgi:hypothetical protein
MVSILDPYTRRFSRLESLFFFQVAPQLYSEAEGNLFQTQYFSENLVVPEIERMTSGSVARNSDH